MRFIGMPVAFGVISFVLTIHDILVHKATFSDVLIGGIAMTVWFVYIAESEFMNK